ncbi:ABC transporter substrate-binding protein [Candidatus Nitronereus thalassa]|uniref:ABC transporter substrate-binding protein n=1 Tax=Candidatus Nitronereus thalassa TaxID=3020898 RepID=A0ABU3K9I4_9BACT|nr:ABC transporter substrate-binding protein [Candidatus Nitronereus thalassa]MDT7043050.1 ABC transporter substrate-binding protein [Candidatus Nitronereus thalassa]
MLVWVFFLAGLVWTGAQEPVWGQDVVVLKSADVGAYNAAASALKESLSPEVEIVEYDLQGDLTQGRKLGKKIRATSARLVVAIGLKAALAAKLEVLDIPIISCLVLDPNKYDLARQNLTGVSLRIPIQTQFALIRNLVPDSKRIGVLFDPTKTNGTIEEAMPLAKRQGLELISSPVTSPQDVPDKLRSLVSNIDVLWLIPDSTVLTEDSLEFLLHTTSEVRVPVVGFSSGLVRSGALAGLYINYAEVGKQVAGLAQKILQGQSIPQGTVLPPERVSLAINKQIAEYLGISISPLLLRDAEEVF